MFRSKEDWSDNAKMLAEAGYVVFNLNYRLLKEDGTNPWPDQFDDVQRAVLAAYGDLEAGALGAATLSLASEWEPQHRL